MDVTRGSAERDRSAGGSLSEVESGCVTHGPERKPRTSADNQFLAGDTRSCGQRGRSRGSLSFGRMRRGTHRTSSECAGAWWTGHAARHPGEAVRHLVSERCKSCPQRPNNQHREAGRRRQTRLRTGDAHPVRHPMVRSVLPSRPQDQQFLADPHKRALTLGSFCAPVKENFCRIYAVCAGFPRTPCPDDATDCNARHTQEADPQRSSGGSSSRRARSRNPLISGKSSDCVSSNDWAMSRI